MDRAEQLEVYRTCQPVVDSREDSDGAGTIVERLVGALAEAEGVDPTDLPPLHDAVDLDALTRLVGEHDGAAAANAVFGFTIDHWNVFVRADGRIRVCDGTRHTDPEPVFADEAV